MKKPPHSPSSSPTPWRARVLWLALAAAGLGLLAVSFLGWQASGIDLMLRWAGLC